MKYITLFITIIMLGACTSEPNTKSENDSLVVIIKQCTFPDSPKEKAPSWVCDGKVPGLVVQAMGLSANKLAGIGHQRQLALLDAQSTLAIQLKSKIDTSIENYNATKGGGVEAQLATSSELKQKLMVSKDVVGSEIYQSVLSENGVFYVLVGLDEKDTKKVVTQVIEKSMKTDNDLWQKAIPSSSSREELKSDLVAFINEG